MIQGPTWLGIGAQKCGTTWFAGMMTQHPQVDIAEGNKEQHWLYRYDLTRPWPQEHSDAYLEMFRSKKDLLLGEWTPYYMRATWAIETVAEIIPKDTPLLVVVRDPIDRFASALRHEIEGTSRRWRRYVKANRRGDLADVPEKLDKGHKPTTGLRRQVTRIAAAIDKKWVHGPPKVPDEAVIDRTWLRFVGSDVSWGGMYASQLDAWRSVFDEDRFMVFQYEKVRRDPQHYVEQVWKRLGLDPVPLKGIERRTKSSTMAETWSLDDFPNVERVLRSMYRADAERLAERYDIDLELWKRTMVS